MNLAVGVGLRGPHQSQPKADQPKAEPIGKRLGEIKVT
jgi:hypothetical protein